MAPVEPCRPGVLAFTRRCATHRPYRRRRHPPRVRPAQGAAGRSRPHRRHASRVAVRNRRHWPSSGYRRDLIRLFVLADWVLLLATKPFIQKQRSIHLAASGHRVLTVLAVEPGIRSARPENVRWPRCSYNGHRTLPNHRLTARSVDAVPRAVSCSRPIA